MTSSWLLNRLRNIAAATLAITLVGVPLMMTIGAKPERAAAALLMFGMGFGSFEEFYLQTKAGEWLRRLPPLVSLSVSIAVAFVSALAATAIMLALWGEAERIGEVSMKLISNAHLVLFIVASLVISLRTVSFVGARTLLCLMTGRYHRPVWERRVLAFIDVRQSTALVERLGPLRGKEAIGGIVTPVSRLVVEYGGEVYIYTGDGLIGTWDWDGALRDGRIVEFATAALAAVKQSEPEFVRAYGVAPAIRIGIHGGEVVVSEQGDLRRAIGIWGDVINIAARLEQAAKELGVDCVISKEIVDNLDQDRFRLERLDPIQVKGVSHRIEAFAVPR